MDPKKSDKPFDCVQFKREAQAKIYEEIKQMSPEEQIAYFRRSAENGPLGEWWKAVRGATPNHAA